MDGENGQSPQLNAVRRRQRVQEENPENVPVVAESQESVPSELAHWIQFNAKELKIRQKDRSWAAEVVNDFRENLLKFLKSEEPLFQSASFLTTGSYFEKVKIHSPDEFDMMLKVQLTTPLDMRKLDGGLYYRIDLVRPTRNPIKSFLLEDKLTISSSRILSETHRLVRKFLNTYKVPDNHCRWEVNRKRLHSPAVTLSLCRTENNSDELISVDVVPALEVQGWPPAVRNGPDVDNWLGKKARQEIKSLPCYFVPKRLKGRKLIEDAKESWRISFSHIEKKIITSHGNKKTCCESNATKCCRKPSLMLLKSLIEGLKQRFPEELDDLCSYHGKTVFLHTLSTRFDDSTWIPQRLPVCFLYLVDALEDHARRGNLPHFFVPGCNLFSTPSFPRKTLAFLVNALEEQKREGLPLLKPPAPAPPLRPTMAAAGTSSCKPAENSFQLTSVHYVILIVVLIVFIIFLLFIFIK